MKLTEALYIRNAALEDEWARRFIRDVRAALDAADRAKTQAQRSS